MKRYKTKLVEGVLDSQHKNRRSFEKIGKSNIKKRLDSSIDSILLVKFENYVALLFSATLGLSHTGIQPHWHSATLGQQHLRFK